MSAKQVMLGNEAIARGIVEAGCHVVTSYPGTPSSEILPEVVRLKKEHGLNIHTEWSVNEKVAYDVALGASYAGKRAAVVMKQVGLNVAADSLMSSAYTGVIGGFVIISCDDPGPHSSQTEQDTRFFAMFAKVPVLDPSDPAEAKELVKTAFELSERYEIPVILRPAIRVCHAKQTITLGKINTVSRAADFKKDPGRWAATPKFRLILHQKLNEKLEKIREEFESFDSADRKASCHSEPRNEFGAGFVSESPCPRAEEMSKQVRHDRKGNASAESSFNIGSAAGAASYRMPKFKSAPFGIIAAGVSFAHVVDILAEFGLEKSVPVLKVTTPYPLPLKCVEKFIKKCRRVLVLEEPEEVIELQIIDKKKLLGRFSGHVPRAGELTPEVVHDILAKVMSGPSGSAGIPAKETDGRSGSAGILAGTNAAELGPRTGDGAVRLPQLTPYDDSLDRLVAGLKLPGRRPTLCPGCPHRASFFAIRKAFSSHHGSGNVQGIPAETTLSPSQGVEGKGEEDASMCGKQDAPHEPIFTSDIGCYTLGLNLGGVDTCLDMGAGITLANGFYRAFALDGKYPPIVATMGDSTFFHSGITALVNAVYNKAGFVLVILDNSITAMTGMQPTPDLGVMADGSQGNRVAIEDVVKGCGVEFMRICDPYNVEEMVLLLKDAHAFATGNRELGARNSEGGTQNGERASSQSAIRNPKSEIQGSDSSGSATNARVAVVIARRPCVVRQRDSVQRRPMKITPDLCKGCKVCLKSFECPALVFVSEKKKVELDKRLCIGCGVCVHACKYKAIVADVGGSSSGRP